MRKNNVTILNLNIHSAKILIRKLAEKSELIGFSSHARERMLQRGVSITQVFKCLKHGNITEGPYRDTSTHDWKIRLECLSAGDVIKVVVAIRVNHTGEKAIIVTVIA